jgi:tRNA 2-selenouridine synthase
MFESLLVKELALWEDTGYIIVECESRRIGRVILPPSLSEAMKSGVKILTYCSIQERKERIKRIYSRDSLQNREELKRAIRSLGRRIGGKRAEEFCDMIDRGLLDEVVEYLLVNYYDPLYKYPAGPCTDYALCVDTTDPDRAAESVKEFLTGRFGK